MLDAATLQELKKTLQNEHDRIVTELKSIAQKNPQGGKAWEVRYPQFAEDEGVSHSSLDEEADEVEEYEMLLEAEHSLESRLLEVKKALTRMEAGVYGRCVVCGKEVDQARLKANPAAEYDLEHTPRNT